MTTTEVQRNTRRDEFRPVEEVRETVRNFPALGKAGLRNLLGLVSRGNMPAQPLATHGDHTAKEAAVPPNELADEPQSPQFDRYTTAPVQDEESASNFPQVD